MTAPTPPPAPPYYLVVFSSLRAGADGDGYGATAARMVELAAEQPGYLGVDSTRGPDGFGITVAYWADEASIAAWRAHAEHTIARESGRARWYEQFVVHVARVERSYAFARAGSGAVDRLGEEAPGQAP